MAKLTEKQMAERYAKQLTNQIRNRAKRQLLIEKAVKAGITVSDAEIDTWIKQHG